MSAAKSPRKRLRFGNIWIDAVNFEEAILAIEEIIVAGRGGSVFTPNVDHLVLADENERFRRAYEDVSLSLVDGVPVLWASRLLGLPLPEKISGSDLMLPMTQRASERGFRIYLLGGADGVAANVAERLEKLYPGLVIAGYESPRIDIDESPARRAEVIARIKEARADLVFVCLGSPKQEIWIHESAAALRPTVLLGVGAAMDFIAGTAQRAPKWISSAGLEWAYRLGHEPRRLWRRYLLRDPKFLAILVRTMRLDPADRIKETREDAVGFRS